MVWGSTAIKKLASFLHKAFCRCVRKQPEESRKENWAITGPQQQCFFISKTISSLFVCPQDGLR
jgi:hypothetical protein